LEEEAREAAAGIGLRWQGLKVVLGGVRGIWLLRGAMYGARLTVVARRR